MNKLEKIGSSELPLENMPEQAVGRHIPTSIEILESAVRGGVTSENVAVVKEIIAMRREEISFENKAQFNRAFFALKKEISVMDFYADKEAKTDGGKTAYTYCSEQEISSKLEPVLFKHGFTMLFGQRQEGDRVVAIVTLIHESGHEEPREYSVRTGNTNKMKDATAVDTGSTTSAWRHLCIKMFGLKSRIREGDDPRNLGSQITQAQADELERRVNECGMNKATFFKLAGASFYGDILTGSYPVLDQVLRMKESQGK